MVSNHNVRRSGSKKMCALLFCALLIAIALSVLLYIYSRTYAKANRIGLQLTKNAFNSIMYRTLPHLLGMSVSAIIIAVVSLSFQTITGSRLLVPSMIGFDSVFVFAQTVIVFILGAESKLFVNPYVNYSITAGAMIAISMCMYGMVLRKRRNNIVFLLMLGIILSGILRSSASYLQVIMDANSYNQVRAATAVTVNNMNVGSIYLVAPIMLVVVAIVICRHRTYDVLSLGVANAKNLGVAYEREVNFNLFLIAIGMSVSTALIGSLTFLGLLAVNIAREIFKTHKHLIIFIGSSLVAVFALIFGQAVTELLQGAVPLTVIIDFIGCAYMFYLILKVNKKS